mgnify:FL=1
MRKMLIALTAAAIGATGVAVAQEPGPFDMQVEARMGIMAYLAIQRGMTGAIAKGEVEYDAAKAKQAADNLAAAVTIDASMLWPEGSDNAAHPDTKALPALWTDPAVGASGKATGEAVAAMQAAAGTDLASLQAAMGPVGEACTACHKLARASD